MLGGTLGTSLSYLTGKFENTHERLVQGIRRKHPEWISLHLFRRRRGEKPSASWICL